MDYHKIVKQLYPIDAKPIDDTYCFTYAEQLWEVSRDVSFENEIHDSFALKTVCILCRINKKLTELHLLFCLDDFYYKIKADILMDDSVIISVYNCDENGIEKGLLSFYCFHPEMVNKLQYQVKEKILEENRYRLRALLGDFDIELNLLNKWDE